MQNVLYATIVRKALSATPVCALLETRNAVVLERIARGGGTTNWYFCADQQCLLDLEESLSPGSAVSFYFDERISSTVYSTELDHILSELVVSSGELLVGLHSSNGQNIDMEIIGGRCELVEFLSTITQGTPLVYGLFPARDNDGINAVTVTLPDIDGVVRPHPH